MIYHISKNVELISALTQLKHNVRPSGFQIFLWSKCQIVCITELTTHAGHPLIFLACSTTYKTWSGEETGELKWIEIDFLCHAAKYSTKEQMFPAGSGTYLKQHDCSIRVICSKNWSSQCILPISNLISQISTWMHNWWYCYWYCY